MKFTLDGLVYVFRDGIAPPQPYQGCNLEEVALAVACERSVELAVIAYRNVGFLTDPENSYYKQIFHGDRELQSEDVWRTVRIFREAAKTLAAERAKLSGRRQQVATHGGRYVLFRTFSDPRVKRLRGDLTPDSLATVRDVLAEHLTKVIDHLEHAPGYLQVLFKNTERMKALDADLGVSRLPSNQDPLPPTADPEPGHLF